MMPWWWLGLAAAEPSMVDETARLLGEPAAVTPQAAAATPASPTLPWWAVMAGIGAIGAVAWSRGRAAWPSVASEPELRVLSRTVTGKDSGLVLIEVRDADGRWRRLLVGQGPTGPQLVTGLGVAGAAPMAAAPASFAQTLDQTLPDDALPEVPAFATAPPPRRPPAPAAPPRRAPIRPANDALDLLAEVRADRARGRRHTWA